MKTTIIAVLVVLLAGCGAAEQPVTPKTPDTTVKADEKTVAQGDLTDGQSRSGEIASADEQDTYDIDLGNATEFSLVEVEGEIDVKVASQEDTDAKSNGLPGPHQFGVSAPGRHKLVVTGHEGRLGEYSFRLVTLKRRVVGTSPGPVTGKLDVPGRVNIHVVEAASVEITDGTPCEDIQLGFSSEAVDEAKTYTPHHVCWNPKHQGEDGKTLIVIWSENGKTGDYSFTVKAG